MSDIFFKSANVQFFTSRITESISVINHGRDNRLHDNYTQMREVQSAAEGRPVVLLFFLSSCRFKIART